MSRSITTYCILISVILSHSFSHASTVDINQPIIDDSEGLLENPLSESTAMDALLDMSLDELMNVSIGTLTENDDSKRPCSVTTITAEDIALTPARNIFDLIETYVPSSLFMNHSEGEELGIRGIIADRSYKFLLLVNGKLMNTKPRHGIRTELSLWELNDIEKIEIVRGPGSVVFGPGAIGGVINITTKDAKSAPGFQAGGHYWGKYDSRGGWLSYGKKGKKADIYSYVSVTRTNGERPDIWVAKNSHTYGYLGESHLYSGAPGTSIHWDLDNEPQVKAHVALDFQNNLKWWTRYTSGSNLYEFLDRQQRLDSSSPWFDYSGNRQRQITSVLEYKKSLAEKWRMSGKFSLDSYDEHDQTKLTAAESNWGENEVYLQGQLHYDSQNKLKTSGGFEYSYEHFGPGWSGDESTFKIGQFVSDTSSKHYKSSRILVGNGWDTYQFALFGEANYRFTEKVSTLLSARLDKHVWTNYMFSPRAALIWKMQNAHYLKLIGQRSVRMTTAYELYNANRTHVSVEPETLDSLELIYEGTSADRLSYHAGAFYNQLEAIGWSDLGTTSVGVLKFAGLEVEADYKGERVRFGANHGYTKQLDWDMAEGIERSGISYSDYNYNAGSNNNPVMLTGNGNDLNNWSNHITKFFTNIKLLDKKVTLHADAQIFWGFEGMKDGLDMIEDASGGGDIYNEFRSHDPFETLVKGNVQLTWHLTEDANLALFVHNISIYGDNKRYYYSTGYTKGYPQRGWQEQPTVVGVKGMLRF